jgi:hypothetical protein
VVFDRSRFDREKGILMLDNEKVMRRHAHIFAGFAAAILIWPQAGGVAAAQETVVAGHALTVGLQYAQAAEPKSPQASPPANPAAPAAQTTPPAAPAAQPPAKSPAATETPAIVMNGQQVVSILSKKVRGADGTDMGRIVDIIADKSGQLRAAIIDFGGFLGVGSRQIAVDWNAIRFPSDGKTDSVEVDLTRDQLRVAPAYKPGEQIVVLGQPSTVGVQTKRPAADAANSAAKGEPSK